MMDAVVRASGDVMQVEDVPDALPHNRACSYKGASAALSNIKYSEEELQAMTAFKQGLEQEQQQQQQ
jgi:hypothetical protein